MPGVDTAAGGFGFPVTVSIETVGLMSDHSYRVIEVVGSSPTSVDDAIKGAITDAAKTIRHIGWFQMVETRGHVENGEVKHFQVTLKIGFTLDDR